MTECSRDVLLYLVLAGIIGLIGFGHARASPIPPPGENIPLTSEDLVQPEYVEALAKELEKESAAELKNQANDKRLSRNSQNDVDRSEFNNKAFSQQRKLVSAHPDKNFSDMVLFPSQLIDMSNHKRNFDEIDRSGFSGFNKRNFDEIDRSGFSSFNKKRNFDEIDRNGFSGFSKKRNFDEIDRSGFSGFNKRNFDEIDRTSFSGFNKKRNFDEIDRNGFSGFSKKRNFDEIDRSGFSGFNKRNFDEIDRSGFSGFNKKRNFDEIDRNGFSGFNKRNFDEIDQAGLPGFAIRSAASSSKLASQ